MGAGARRDHPDFSTMDLLRSLTLSHFLSVCVCVCVPKIKHTHDYAHRYAHTSPLTLTHFLGRRINYYSVCRSLRLIPPVMDVTLCGAAKCVLEMCLELLCGTAECFWNEIITG